MKCGDLTWDGTHWQRDILAYDERTGMTATDRIALAEFKHEHIRDERWAKKARLDHLRQVWKWLKINDLSFDIQAEAWQNMPVHPIHHQMLAARHSNTLDKMIAVLREVRFIKRPKEKARDSDVTPMMIASAREYPIEEILAEFMIEINHHNKFLYNKFLCPYHDDTRPSMSLRNNRVKCFSCGKADDAIGLYMNLSGASFPAAVRRLAT